MSKNNRLREQLEKMGKPEPTDLRPRHRQGFEGWYNQYPIKTETDYSPLEQEDELEFRKRFVSHWGGEPVKETGYTNQELLRYLQGHRDWQEDPCWDRDPNMSGLSAPCGPLATGEECPACGKVGGIRYGR